VKLAGRFDILFVNNFGLPFFSGFAFFFYPDWHSWFGWDFAGPTGADGPISALVSGASLL
jgi:hypothetical protein